MWWFLKLVFYRFGQLTDFAYLCTKITNTLLYYMQQKIVILDFGSQTTQLIGRRVRELDTFCEILPYNKFPKMIPQSLV